MALEKKGRDGVEREGAKDGPRRLEEGSGVVGKAGKGGEEGRCDFHCVTSKPSNPHLSRQIFLLLLLYIRGRMNVNSRYPWLKRTIAEIPLRSATTTARRLIG